MRGLKGFAAAAVAVGVLAAATAAQAVTRELTFYGDVVSLFDEADFFRPDALGTPRFTAVVSFDLPSTQVVNIPGAQVIRGGGQIFLPPVVSGRLTFAGLTHTFANGQFGLAGVGGGEAAVSIRGLVGGEQEQLDLLAQLGLSVPADLSVDFDLTHPMLDTGSAFRIWNTAADQQVLGVVLIDRVTLADAALAVPEPATWALMIGGFGMAGAALRRRVRVAVAA